ncbi:MAG TPA: hypothetical protein GXX19_07470 [Syntrophomonadaceae bacterium]|nr:hypothetical protein [Syntrophomonadaceae bacterium]
MGKSTVTALLAQEDCIPAGYRATVLLSRFLCRKQAFRCLALLVSDGYFCRVIRSGTVRTGDPARRSDRVLMGELPVLLPLLMLST